MGKIVAIGRSAKAKAAARSPATDRPSRSDAEDAVRTLIRWAGDNPNRQGLLGTPARVVRAYEEWFSGYTEEPRDYLGLRAPPRSDHRPSPYRLSSAQSRGRDFKARKACRRLCQAASDPGKNDCGNRLLPGHRAQAVWGRGGHRGGAPMHDHPRRAQVERHNGDEPDAGGLPQAPGNAARVPVRHQPARCGPAIK